MNLETNKKLIWLYLRYSFLIMLSYMFYVHSVQCLASEKWRFISYQFVLLFCLLFLAGLRCTYFFLHTTWVECRFFQFGTDLVIHLSLFVINIVVHLSLNINH